MVVLTIQPPEKSALVHLQLDPVFSGGLSWLVARLATAEEEGSANQALRGV